MLFYWNNFLIYKFSKSCTRFIEKYWFFASDSSKIRPFFVLAD
ncbi:hypothetical protein HPSNAG_0249 [Glaesserella parasuis str. Nagasaki]|nr:hypothetical protein HPSNAG_0249 [Glaesserella parasuis str. Nagasaki]